MSKLEKTLTVLDSLELGEKENMISIDNRSLLIVTVLFLIAMLGIPVEHIDNILWFTLYPIIAAPMFRLKYSKIFLQSLIILPLVLLLAVFNPLIDTAPALTVGGTVISKGWLSFTGILMRGLLSMQALLIMIHASGFIGMVRGMEKLGIPKFLTTQLLMVFRYIKVLIEEVIVMNFAREARSFGKKGLSLRQWGQMIGELFIRSVDRAERIHRSMLARGFDGSIPAYGNLEAGWQLRDVLFIGAWGFTFLFLRIYNLSLLFAR